MTNEIYTEDKMKQLPVYPTKQTPSYADWNLFKMGQALEDKVDSQDTGIPTPTTEDAGMVLKVNESGEYALAEDDVGTRLMAGTGVEIVSDTINNTAPNVQADWNQTTDTEPDYIKNKPTIPSAQVNADWNAVSGVAEILNKPTIPDVTTKANVSLNNVNVGSANAGKYLTVDADGNISFSEAPSSGSSDDGAIFLNWDGTVITTMTPQQVANATELPALPTNGTLITYLRWNWTLVDIKQYVAKYGKCFVGTVIKPTDDLNHLFVSVIDGQTLTLTGTAGTIDWGDGDTTSSLTHTYITGGYYEIKFGTTYTGILYQTELDRKTVIYSVFKSGFNVRGQQNMRLCNISDGSTSIVNDAFNGCYSLHSITIPDGVTIINNNAFRTCYSLKSVTIPNGVTSINTAFYACTSLYSVTIPDSVLFLGDSAFMYCYSLHSIIISDGVTRIYDSAFRNCQSLYSVTISDRVTSIGASAFDGCYALHSITIPDGVTSIGSNAFQYCYSLHIKIKSPTVPLDNFYYIGPIFDFTEMTSVPSTAPSYAYTEYYVNANMVSAFKAAWTSIANNIVVGTFPLTI